MSRPHWKYVLVGGGVASSSAAVAIRQRDPEGSVLLVGQEVIRPYHRPPLSKAYLLGSRQRPELFTLAPQWFAEHHVDLRTACRASHLDTARHSLMLESGEEVAFDKLLIATGGTPKAIRIPGAELPNVFYLRSLDDADRLHNAVEKARQEGRPHERGRGRVVILGAGLLGVELAATFTRLGLAVDLLCARPQPWSKFAGEATGRVLIRYLENRSVRVHPLTTPLRLEGDGRVQRVITSGDDTLECDFVLPAIGITPLKDLLRGTALAAEQAILVDAYGRTSDSAIYAAGDCAAMLDPLFGKYRLLDHWDSAVATGTLTGANMAGANQPYDAVNHFSTIVFDLSVSVWGEARVVERRIVRGNQNPEAPDFIEFGVAADGRMAQVLAAGHAGDDQILCDLVRRRIHVEGRESLLRDPASQLADLLR